MATMPRRNGRRSFGDALEDREDECGDREPHERAEDHTVGDAARLALRLELRLAQVDQRRREAYAHRARVFVKATHPQILPARKRATRAKRRRRRIYSSTMQRPDPSPARLMAHEGVVRPCGLHTVVEAPKGESFAFHRLQTVGARLILWFFLGPRAAKA